MTDADMKQLADEHAINRVLAEYCLRLEVSAFDEWLDLFTEDAVYEVFRRSLTGRAEISAMLSQAPHGVHLPGAARIVINGDSAQVIQSYMFLPTSNDESILFDTDDYGAAEDWTEWDTSSRID